AASGVNMRRCKIVLIVFPLLSIAQYQKCKRFLTPKLSLFFTPDNPPRSIAAPLSSPRGPRFSPAIRLHQRVCALMEFPVNSTRASPLGGGDALGCDSRRDEERPVRRPRSCVDHTTSTGP